MSHSMTKRTMKIWINSSKIMETMLMIMMNMKKMMRMKMMKATIWLGTKKIDTLAMSIINSGINKKKRYQIQNLTYFTLIPCPLSIQTKTSFQLFDNTLNRNILIKRSKVNHLLLWITSPIESMIGTGSTKIACPAIKHLCQSKRTLMIVASSY